MSGDGLRVPLATEGKGGMKGFGPEGLARVGGGARSGKGKPSPAWAQEPADDAEEAEAPAAQDAAAGDVYDNFLRADFCDEYLNELPEPLRKCFRAAFGMEAEPASAGVTNELMVAITVEEAQTQLKAAKVVTDPSTEKDPTGLELMRMMAPLKRAHRRAAQLEAGLLERPVAPSAPTAAQPALPAQPQEEQGHLKYTDVLWQGKPGTFKMLPWAELEAARNNYEDIKGGPPPLEERPSNIQLSALSSWLATRPGGMMAHPFVDFGVWTPTGTVATQPGLSGRTPFNADGQWAPKRHKGPATYRQWIEHWKVFEAAMMSLRAATPVSLEA